MCSAALRRHGDGRDFRVPSMAPNYLMSCEVYSNERIKICKNLCSDTAETDFE
jgi:hypothetical protein